MFSAMNCAVAAAAVLISASYVIGFPMLLGEPDMEDTGEMFVTKPAESAVSDTSGGSLAQQIQQASMMTDPQLQSTQLMASEEPLNIVEGGGNALPQQVSGETSPDMQMAQQVSAETSPGIQMAQQVSAETSPGIQMAQQVSAETSPGIQMAQQAGASEIVEEPKMETMQSDQPDMTMLADQPESAVDQSQILAAQAQEIPVQQPTLCPLASDCPEKEMEAAFQQTQPAVSQQTQPADSQQTQPTVSQQTQPTVSQQTQPTATSEPSPPEHIVVMESDDQNTDKFELPTVTSPSA